MSTLTLNIPKKEREGLLTKGPKPLRPLLQKFFEQSDEPTKGNEAAVVEAAVTPSVQVPRKVRLSDVVRPVFEQGEGTEYEDQNEHPLHLQFVEELANALAEVMVFDSAAATPLSDEDIKRGEAAIRLVGFEDHTTAARISKNGQEILERITQQNAETMATRLRTEPKNPPNDERWIEKVADFSKGQNSLFTHEHFPTFEGFEKMTREFTRWTAAQSTESWKGGKQNKTEARKALMNNLLVAMGECVSIEKYLSISLSMFWVATDLLALTLCPLGYWSRRGNVSDMLRYYVAAVLLVESVV